MAYGEPVRTHADRAACVCVCLCHSSPCHVHQTSYTQHRNSVCVAGTAARHIRAKQGLFLSSTGSPLSAACPVLSPSVVTAPCVCVSHVSDEACYTKSTNIQMHAERRLSWCLTMSNGGKKNILQKLKQIRDVCLCL